MPHRVQPGRHIVPEQHARRQIVPAQAREQRQHGRRARAAGDEAIAVFFDQAEKVVGNAVAVLLLAQVKAQRQDMRGLRVHRQTARGRDEFALVSALDLLVQGAERAGVEIAVQHVGNARGQICRPGIGCGGDEGYVRHADAAVCAGVQRQPVAILIVYGPEPVAHAGGDKANPFFDAGIVPLQHAYVAIGLV